VAYYFGPPCTSIMAAVTVVDRMTFRLYLIYKKNSKKLCQMNSYIIAIVFGVLRLLVIMCIASNSQDNG